MNSWQINFNIAVNYSYYKELIYKITHINGFLVSGGG